MLIYEIHQVCLDNNDLRDLSVNWLRKNIGVVGQEPVLFNTTIGENIKYGNDSATQEEIEFAAKQSNAHDFIKILPKVCTHTQIFYIIFYTCV